MSFKEQCDNCGAMFELDILEVYLPPLPDSEIWCDSCIRDYINSTAERWAQW